MLPLSKYTFYNCHLSPAVNDPAIKWKQCMMMVRLVMIRLVMVRSVMLMVRLVMIRLVMVRLVVIGAGARINMVVNTKDISVSLNHVHSPSLATHSMLLSHVPA